MSTSFETLILTRSDVHRALDPAACARGIEVALGRRAEGHGVAPGSLGFESHGGTFHVKAALYDAGRPRFVAKLNGNFPANPATRGLPTIQGMLMLADAADGRPLAIIDSSSLTAIRTAAASAVAAAHLARAGATIAAIIGCGLQGAAHVDALLAARPLREIRFFDVDAARAESLSRACADRLGVTVRVAPTVRDATRGAHLVATCTPGAAFVLDEDEVDPGTFVAAVGADNPGKREIHPALMRRARVVADDLAQCVKWGDLHHAIEAGVMTSADAHAELGAVIAGQRPGRDSEDQVFVFDSTGIAIEDAVAADLAYERALELELGRRVVLSA
jgi:ornithine cyclodeaminase/alanine dehydrogenase-like protein (mu-crystallin family)